MDLDNTKIIAEDWVLKPTLNAVSLYCYDTQKSYADFKYVDRIVKVVGTELQLLNLFKKLFIEEALQLRGSFKKEATDLDLKLYKENNNEALIIN